MTYDVPVGANIAEFIKDKNAVDEDVFKLGVGEYSLLDYTEKLRFDSHIAINGKEGSIIKAQKVSQLTGIKGWIFQDITIDGRLNIDDGKYPSEKIEFFNIKSLSNINTVGTENFKLTRTKSVLISNCYFERTVNANGIGQGSTDRLVDIVGGNDIEIMNCNFYNGNNGAIQAKGGVLRFNFHDNFVNYCGQRAIQIGGSTCWHPQNTPPTGCWGKDSEGVYISPKYYGWEAIDCKVHDNIVVSNGSCISISTQSGTKVFNNTFYIPRDTGGIFLMRFLQEVEPDSIGLLRPSEQAQVYNNAFLYPITKDGGKAGINGAIINWNDGQNFNSFAFHNNAVYATSPITSPGFGKLGVYQHRHMVTDGPSKYMPFNWKVNLLDQVYPDVIDWGLPSMQLYGYADRNIGCRRERVGAKNMPLGRISPSPISLKGYPENQPLYGWEGCGSYRYPDKLSKVSEALNNVKW